MRYKFLLLTICISANAFAQWSTDPKVNTIWETSENQGAPVICTDGNGGAIVAWGSDRGVFANHVDKYGYRQWGNDGVQISPLGRFRVPTNILPDGQGGAVILWEDFNQSFQMGVQDNPENEMYAQGVDNTGTILWDSSGVLIRERIEGKRIGDFQMVSDDYQSFMVSWFDRRTDQWYVQRLDAGGSLAFEANGRPIPAENQIYNSQRQVVSDGRGGMLMARGNDVLGVVVERVSKSGEFPWPLGGIPTNSGGPIGMVSDGQGGAILSGSYRISAPPNPVWEGRVQHIDSTGKLLWGETGKVFAPDADVRTFPRIVFDGQGGAFVTWPDTTSGKRERYVARFNQDGEMLWKVGPFQWNRSINGPPNIHNEKKSIIWLEIDVSTLQGDLYAFRVDSSGIANWGMDGILIRYRDFEEWPYFLEVTHNGSGGFIAVWAERHRTGWQNLGLQQISIHGNLGEVITNVEETSKSWQYPQDFFLFPTYPNPSNPVTKIRFSLRTPAKVELRVFNVTGKLVRTFAGKQFTAGTHELFWNGQTQTGKEVSSGIYFIRLFVNGHVQLRKHLLIH